MYHNIPDNEKMEFASEATTPSEHQTPPTYPSPQPNHYHPRIHPYHSHHHGPRQYHGPNYGFYPEFGQGGWGAPPPPPHANFSHEPRPHDPFFFGGKHQKKHQKKRVLQKVLIGSTIVCGSLFMFNLGRGYQFSFMSDNDFHHNEIGHPHRGPHMNHEFGIEASRGEDFRESKFGHPGNFGGKHGDSPSETGERHEFIGGKPHGIPPHELGDHFNFRPLDDLKGPAPPFPEFGEPHGGKHHPIPEAKHQGKGPHKGPDGPDGQHRPDEPKTRYHNKPKKVVDPKKVSEGEKEVSADLKKDSGISEGSE